MFDYLTKAKTAGRLSMAPGTLTSLLVHAALVVGFVYDRAQRDNLAAETWEETPQGLLYIAPPDVNSAASQVQITFESGGGAEGTADPTDATDGLGARVRGSGPGESAVASASSDDAPEQIAVPTDDPYENAFSSVEVESAAERDPSSAAPAYPRELMQAGIEGYAAMRFVVDSMGRVDLSSVRVLQTTHPEFAAAVKAAMPGMRFTPARLGDRPVRQLAEQLFAFQIQPTPPKVSESGVPATAQGPRRP
ncbi:MAG: TonB family protein [Gemmatimonadaceae bacterium]|nr:TonB family protein [Gemmatimonadaceae bacterium]